MISILNTGSEYADFLDLFYLGGFSSLIIFPKITILDFAYLRTGSKWVHRESGLQFFSLNAQYSLCRHRRKALIEKYSVKV